MLYNFSVTQQWPADVIRIVNLWCDITMVPKQDQQMQKMKWMREDGNY